MFKVRGSKFKGETAASQTRSAGLRPAGSRSLCFVFPKREENSYAHTGLLRIPCYPKHAGACPGVWRKVGPERHPNANATGISNPGRWGHENKVRANGVKPQLARLTKPKFSGPCRLRTFSSISRATQRPRPVPCFQTLPVYVSLSAGLCNALGNKIIRKFQKIRKFSPPSGVTSFPPSPVYGMLIVGKMFPRIAEIWTLAPPRSSPS